MNCGMDLKLTEKSKGKKRHLGKQRYGRKLGKGRRTQWGEEKGREPSSANTCKPSQGVSLPFRWGQSFSFKSFFLNYSIYFQKLVSIFIWGGVGERRGITNPYQATQTKADALQDKPKKRSGKGRN